MPPTVSTPGAVSASLAKDRLGVFAVIMFAMTAAAPLLVVGGLVESGWAATGVTGLPLAFVLIGIVLFIFSAGYVAMSRHVVNAGAFYSYIALGANKPFGVGASFVAVVAYNMLQIGLYGIFGVVANGFIQEKFDANVDWWICSLVAWAIVAVMGALRVDINSKIIGVLLAIEIVVVLVMDAADFAHPFSGYALSTFKPDALFNGGLFGAAGVAFAIVITSFVGFEAAPVFSEEARHRTRTVPAATYLAIAVMGVLYLLTTWAMSVAVGADNVVGRAQSDGPDMIFNVAGKEGGLGASFIPDLGHVLLLTSVFAAMVSYHNSVARYSFALGREGVLPRIVGHTRPRTGAPLVASIIQSVVAVIVIGLFAYEGWDPLLKLFFWLGTNGGFGILVLLVGTSLSVIKFFARDHRGESIWARVFAPIISTIALGYMLYVTTKNYNLLIGVSGTDIWRWILPGIYLGVAILGILWALWLRATRRDVYDAIGLGAQAGTAVQAMTAGSMIPPIFDHQSEGTQPMQSYDR
jgi:amino acid transporter